MLITDKLGLESADWEKGATCICRLYLRSWGGTCFHIVQFQCALITFSPWPMTPADHYHLGGRQAGVCAEGRDWGKRLDSLGGWRWASSGEKTSASTMNINVCSLGTLIQTPNASQHCMCSEYIYVWHMNQSKGSGSRSITCMLYEVHDGTSFTLWKYAGICFPNRTPSLHLQEILKYFLQIMQKDGYKMN